ncbi:MAG: bifunctional glutamate N-acetyltransferase/amino-acid acetyltransferase ArgJ [Planctomycetaceae bacterium]|jgi:glutamate N-acetyltransferase/amino-acid N-acetyltransferase|nr:bifunctional glutamate N-acetyltransferase/amino-acid acetyltransferase ArgJ [Planctomycetaceae bacterium]
MNIYLPKGYRFAAVHCGLKSDPMLLDLSIIVSDIPAVVAGVFTPNLVCGAPVQVDRNRVPGQGFRAVVANSRYANACTGEQGIRDAEEMAALAAQSVGGHAQQGLVMSTGVIGTQLPMDKIRNGIAAASTKLAASETEFLNAARGIMTTDTVEKYVTKLLTLKNGEIITVAGICKGAAMIAPKLATMLAVIVTDAALESSVAQKLLQTAAEESFNCISVEGHTSTSDTLLLLANGAALPTPLHGENLELFANTLRELCIELAVKIPEDGEGVSHLITIDIEGCKTRDDAKIIARKIAEDALVKTAICGADPNWGRIVSASGTAGVFYDPKKVSLKLNGFELFKNGEPIPFDKKNVSNSIRNNRATHILLTFGEGNTGIRFWTTDLTTEYVRLNSDYTT